MSLWLKAKSSEMFKYEKISKNIYLYFLMSYFKNSW
jgi:hypothetical protein